MGVDGVPLIFSPGLGCLLVAEQVEGEDCRECDGAELHCDLPELVQRQQRHGLDGVGIPGAPYADARDIQELSHILPLVQRA